MSYFCSEHIIYSAQGNQTEDAYKHITAVDAAYFFPFDEINRISTFFKLKKEEAGKVYEITLNRQFLFV